MVTLPRDRFVYSSPFTRPVLRLPKGRMIVWSVVNIEEWEITRPLARALEKAGVTPTMSINAKVCETYPEVATAARAANWEFMAHAFVQMPIQQIADQRAVMRQSIEVIEKFNGKRPTGWLGPGRGQTFETLDYVAECGFS